LDPLIKSPPRAVVLKVLFSQRVAKRRVKGQYLAVDFPNGVAPATYCETAGKRSHFFLAILMRTCCFNAPMHAIL
jgi:hypothetical protein